MTTKVKDKEKITTTAKPEGEEKNVKEKVRAGEDVIAYAETNKQEAPANNEALAKVLPKSKKEEAPKKKKELPSNEAGSEIIYGFDRTSGETIQMALDKITALSRYIYVHNIFDASPIVEAVTYRAIGPGTRHVTMDINEATFEDLRQMPKFKGHVHYNYIDNMMKNDPDKGRFIQRTFHVNYPEWIKAADVAEQVKALASHYGIPDLSGIEKVLWPNLAGKIAKPSLSEDVKEEEEDAEEDDSVQS